MKSWFDVSTTQTPRFVLFAGAGVLFDGAFSLWVSLICFQHFLDFFKLHSFSLSQPWFAHSFLNENEKSGQIKISFENDVNSLEKTSMIFMKVILTTLFFIKCSFQLNFLWTDCSWNLKTYTFLKITFRTFLHFWVQ